MAKLLTYEQKDTWMDRLCGVTKLIYFLAWSITSMLTYDTRVLAVMLVLSLILFKISKTEWKQVGSIFKFIMFFLVINVLAIFIFAPDQGTKIYGTKHVLWQLSAHYPITAEQLFYELNIILKYFTIIPAVFIFVVTTNPSEFAASLNRIGISYNIGYAVAIALRYIPDVQDDFHKIKNETTKSNNTYKIVQIFKKYCIESYKLCGNPPKKAVFPTIKRELKKRCMPPNQVI